MLIAIYLGGLAGEGMGEINALNTSSILNQINPTHLYITSVAILPDSDMFQDVQSGHFIEATELDRIKEILALVENIKKPIVILSQSVANPVNFIAELPRDKDELIQVLKIKIGTFSHRDETLLRRHREALRTI